MNRTLRIKNKNKREGILEEKWRAGIKKRRKRKTPGVKKRRNRSKHYGENEAAWSREGGRGVKVAGSKEERGEE